MESALMKVREVAAELRISQRTAYTLVASGQLKSVHIGRLIRVTRAALDEFMEASESKPGW